MPNPWDPLPFPTRGDTDDAKTYEGAGRVLSQWESVEFQLSRLYSIFVGDPDGDAMQEYGRGNIFRIRLEALNMVAQRYFVSHPHQSMEAQFDCLCKAATGFADRRNEVAHGTVFAVDGLTFFAKKFGSATPQFALIPSFYTIKKHTIVDGDSAPTYAYCFRQLWSLTASLNLLVNQLGSYRLALLAL